MRASRTASPERRVPQRAGAGALARAGRYVAEGFAEAFWPTRCVGCDIPGTLLCPDCAAALPAIDQRFACPRCGAPFGSLVCTECTRFRDKDEDGPLPVGVPDPRLLPAPPFDDLDALRCYGIHEWPLDRLVRAYKDGNERRAASLLAALLVQASDDGGLVGEGRVDAVAFVPCTPAAFARRGFDHMERVARAAAERLGLPALDVLARCDTRDQRGLSREQRSHNAQDSLAATQRLDGMRLLLLDDVVTTGATLGAAARVLRAAGIASVCAAAVARAW